jgi:hypothetical protein
MESIQIYLNSLNADKYFNGSSSDCAFILPIIEIPDGFHIYLSVQKCLIPYSFYNINSTNNTLKYTANSINYSITILHEIYGELIDIKEERKIYKK